MKSPTTPQWSCTFTLIVAIVLMFSTTAEQAPKTVTLQEGSAIPVALKSSISSENCQRDQLVDCAVTQDVKVDGITVIKAGAPVRAQVDECQKRGIAGQPGKLRIVIISVKAVDGQNIPLRASASRIGEEKTGQAIGGALFCAPLILTKGEASSYPAGTEFMAFTAASRDIEVK
jgi:hypothetical protein